MGLGLVTLDKNPAYKTIEKRSIELGVKQFNLKEEKMVLVALYLSDEQVTLPN